MAGSRRLPPGDARGGRTEGAEAAQRRAAARVLGAGPAGAGVWSTAGDLVRFGRAILRGGELDGVRVLPAPYVALMTREQTTGGIGANEDPLLLAHYALGWATPEPRTSPASPARSATGGSR